MDIHLIPNAVPTTAERDAVNAVLGPPPTAWEGAAEAPVQASRGGHEAREQRHLLLPALHALQRRAGFISPGGLNYVCRRLTIPPAEAYGVASFYALFALDEQAPRVAHVCDDIVCRVKGGEDICAALEQRLGRAGEPALDGTVTWQRSPCLGLCELAPAVLIQQTDTYGDDEALAPTNAGEVLDALHTSPLPPLRRRRGGQRG